MLRQKMFLLVSSLDTSKNFNTDRYIHRLASFTDTSSYILINDFWCYILIFFSLITLHNILFILINHLKIIHQQYLIVHHCTSLYLFFHTLFQNLHYANKSFLSDKSSIIHSFPSLITYITSLPSFLVVYITYIPLSSYKQHHYN